MVLIISSEDDLSTNDVIDWLIYLKIPFLRISHLDKIYYTNVKINLNQFSVDLFINNVEYNLTDFTFFWYRRSFLNMHILPYDNKSKLGKEIKRHLESEAQEINRIVKSYIQNNSLNKHNDIFLNKLESLIKAKELKINIPDTLVTNNKKDLLEFIKNKNGVITKNISQGIFINYKDKVLGNSTTIVDKTIIKNIPNTFHFMMFQENIEKLFEIRSFYIYGKFYSSAIFSQSNEKTKIDFRNYDFEKTNRTPIFELPLDIKSKLKKLMNILNLNSGSIDIIVSNKNEYIFLEVNPIGQFSQVSIPCNYYIEKIIANKIKDKHAKR